MPDKIYLIVTLRKEVADNEAGKAVYDLVKTRLAEYPDVEISAHVTNHFSLDE